MAGTGIIITHDMAKLTQRLDRLTHLALDDLLDNMGSEVENQTRRRISDEKTAPDGSDWPEWSERYAATREEHHSLLQGEGDLLDSMTYDVEGDAVVVGSPLVYAAIQHFGGEAVGKALPPHPYLGLSDENEEDLMALIDDWCDMQLEAI
ncbi:Mu phage tail completion protein GpG [Desulfoluna limicola]|uniref:Mu phage tail completion protein GpG n=1 Tax=Desulfoluna limicola TaxID=2810562 RepID=A0ABM7PC13_9BACT|nr:phage virion morphogenesis protein [Desulfoluna limicola]BCS94612.1 Mu phage tail completion protein GpG [Desulfoluna limicola]